MVVNYHNDKNKNPCSHNGLGGKKARRMEGGSGYVHTALMYSFPRLVRAMKDNHSQYFFQFPN